MRRGYITILALTRVGNIITNMRTINTFQRPVSDHDTIFKRECKIGCFSKKNFVLNLYARKLVRLQWRSLYRIPQIRRWCPHPPIAQWGNGRDLIFGTYASLVMTTGAIKAIFEFPPQSWEIGGKLPFCQQKSKSVFPQLLGLKMEYQKSPW